MRKKERYQQIRNKGKLPTPSRVALEVMRLCYADSASLQEITGVIETDPALSAEMLKYANSSVFSPVSPVGSVRRAAVMIGMRGVVNLAISVSMLSTEQESNCTGFSYSRFWSKSLAQAVASRKIAQRDKSFEPDELFTCSLLSHVGELALASVFPDEYSAILSQELSWDELLLAENNTFGIDHTALTVEMLEDWGVPKKYCLAVKHYRATEQNIANEEIPKLSRLIYLSRQVANICMLDLPLKKTFTFLERSAEEFSIPASSFNQFFDDVVNSWQEWGNLFQIPTQHCPLYYQIKATEEPTIEEEVNARENEDIVILAVDDDPLTLLNLSRLLQGEKRTILTAEDGKEALQIIENNTPEMVITDWRMPKIDGLQLCRALRSANRTQHTYIIMLTGNEADDELVQAFDAGADDYVVKPFTPNVLEARIRSGERLIRYQRTINADHEVIQRYATKLAAANRKLQTMAMTDALTELPNRRSAMARLNDVVAESSRHGDMLSCLMIDIDHFKQINDTYGHENGDTVLKEVAGIFLTNARSYDMVSRMGGEEFLVISTRSSRDDAEHLAQRLREAVASAEIGLSDGRGARVTISVGVACWDESFANGESLIRAADNALYRAKKEGRNRVITAWEID